MGAVGRSTSEPCRYTSDVLETLRKSGVVTGCAAKRVRLLVHRRPRCRPVTSCKLLNTGELIDILFSFLGGRFAWAWSVLKMWRLASLAPLFPQG